MLKLTKSAMRGHWTVVNWSLFNMRSAISFSGHNASLR